MSGWSGFSFCLINAGFRVIGFYNKERFIAPDLVTRCSQGVEYTSGGLVFLQEYFCVCFLTECSSLRLLYDFPIYIKICLYVPDIIQANIIQ